VAVARAAVVAVARAVVGGGGGALAGVVVADWGAVVEGGQMSPRRQPAAGLAAAGATWDPKAETAARRALATASSSTRRTERVDIGTRRYPGMVTETSTTSSPARTDPILEGDHERMAHIVLEGVTTEEGEFVSAGPSVVEGIINATPVRALCGKVWVPGRDPRRYPVCPTCQDIAKSLGWDTPAG